MDQIDEDVSACDAGKAPEEGAKNAPAGVGVSRRTVLISTAATGATLALSQLPTGCATSRKPASTQAVASTAPANTMPVTLRINGESHAVDLDPRTSLLDTLREHLNLTGTKKGCDHGQCGACTVLVDGKRVNSCLTLAVMTQGKEITSIEGIASGENLHPVQNAFIEHDAFQCGYCTPGQICSAVALIKEGHAKSDADIREEMSGNICRCGAYPNIVDAIKAAMTHA